MIDDGHSPIGAQLFHKRSTSTTAELCTTPTVRRLGTVALMDADRFEEYSGKLGMEPLGP